jgi:hypothetical protein
MKDWHTSCIPVRYEMQVANNCSLNHLNGLTIMTYVDGAGINQRAHQKNQMVSSYQL